jgi:WD40 repeat protein
VRLWDLHGGRDLQGYERHASSVSTLAVLPDGTRVLSGSDDKTIRLWDLQSGTDLRRFVKTKDPYHFQITAVAALPVCGQALFAAKDATSSDIQLLDLEAGRVLPRFELPFGGGWAKALAVLPARGQALSAGSDGRVRLWDLESGSEVRCFEGHDDQVDAVAALPDGTRALSGSQDNTMRLWDLESGTEIHRFEGHSGSVRAVAALPERGQALSGGDDCTVRLWDIASGTEVQRFAGHPVGDFGGVSAVATLAHRREALSAGLDGTLRLWDLESGAELAVFSGDAAFTCCAVTPDARFAVVGDDGGQIHVLEICTENEVRQSKTGWWRRSWSGIRDAIRLSRIFGRAVEKILPMCTVLRTANGRFSQNGRS